MEIPILQIDFLLKRPITPIDLFDEALVKAEMTIIEEQIIEYIRFIGVFNQVTLAQALKLDSKPPVLSILCVVCRKIGEHMPDHFEAVRKWSQNDSEYGVRWDGNLVCSTAWNSDGERLIPESGTTQYHTFVVHKELFQGLN